MRFICMAAALMLAASCADGAREDVRTGEGDRAVRTGYLAIVGTAEITMENVRSIPESARPLYSGQEGFERLIIEEMLYQEALRKNIDKDPEYLRLAGYSRRKALIDTLLHKEAAGKARVEERELREYYRRNPDEFTSDTGQVIEFNAIRENLAKMLLKNKQNEALDRYIAAVKKKYPVKVNEAVIPPGLPR